MSLITSYGGGGDAAAGGRKSTGGVKKPDKSEDGEPSGPNNMKPGCRIFAKFRDGTERRAVVVDRKPQRTDDGVETGQWKYYVHYIDLNRRMDTWVGADDVRYDAEAEAQARQERAKAEKAAKTGGSSSSSAATAAAAGDHHHGEGKGAKHGGGVGKGYGSSGKDGKATGASAGAGAGGQASSSSSHAAAASHGHGGGGGHGSHHHPTGDDEIMDVDGTILRAKRKADGELVIENVEPEHETAGLTEASLREHEEITKVKNVNFIELGEFRMETWYFSPLPKEYWPNDVVDTVRFLFAVPIGI